MMRRTRCSGKPLRRSPGTNAWTKTDPMPDPRESGSAVSLQDGSVLLIGGSVLTPDGGTDLLSSVRFIPGS